MIAPIRQVEPETEAHRRLREARRLVATSLMERDDEPAKEATPVSLNGQTCSAPVAALVQ